MIELHLKSENIEINAVLHERAMQHLLEIIKTTTIAFEEGGKLLKKPEFPSNKLFKEGGIIYEN